MRVFSINSSTPGHLRRENGETPSSTLSRLAHDVKFDRGPHTLPHALLPQCKYNLADHHTFASLSKPRSNFASFPLCSKSFSFNSAFSLCKLSNSYTTNASATSRWTVSECETTTSTASQPHRRLVSHLYWLTSNLPTWILS